MTGRPEVDTLGDLLSSWADDLKIIDKRIANAHPDHVIILQQIRNGVMRSRQKLSYLINGHLGIARDIKIHPESERQELLKLIDSMNKKKHS